MQGAGTDTTCLSIAALLARAVELSGDATAIHVRREGLYRASSWNELADDVWRLTDALRRLGVQVGDRVAQLSENRYEWIIADQAIQAAGGIHVPIHPPLAAEQVGYQLRDCGARWAMVSSPPQIEKVRREEASLPAGFQLIAYDPSNATIRGNRVLALDHLLAEADPGRGHDVHLETIQRTGADSLATILYTSGTTGEPKGVMLTQGNLVSNAEGTIEAFGMTAADLRLSFLPLSHIFARTCDLYVWIASRSQLALADSRDSVLKDCVAIRPTLMNGVPYFFDRVRRTLDESGRADAPGALRELLGGRLRFCCSGGAALPDHLFDYFLARDMPILQGYGLSETSPVISLSSPTAYKRGTSGRPISNVEVRVAADGELLTRGPHVMRGYYNKPDATAEVLRDGWFHTGDLGHLDADGFVVITGRKKELLVTAGGKNVAPVYLESLLTEDPLILQAMVVGDGQKYLAALIVPNVEQLQAELTRQGLAIADSSSLLADRTVRSWYQQRIEQRLQCVSYYEQVRRFLLIDRSFSIEQGELTPKLSLRRDTIARNFAREISALYQ